MIAVDDLNAVVEWSGILIRCYQGFVDGFAEILRFPVLVAPTGHISFPGVLGEQVGSCTSTESEMVTVAMMGLLLDWLGVDLLDGFGELDGDRR